MAVSELARQHGFSPASFYAWRAKYGGMEAEDAKRLKGLESETNRLRRLLAGAHLDIEALKVGFGVKHYPRSSSARHSSACLNSRRCTSARSAAFRTCPAIHSFTPHHPPPPTRPLRPAYSN